MTPRDEIERLNYLVDDLQNKELRRRSFNAIDNAVELALATETISVGEVRQYLKGISDDLAEFA